MAWWLSVRIHITGVVSSNPISVTMKAPLVRKVTGNHLIESTSQEKNLEPYLWFLLHSKSSMLNTIVEEGNGKPPHRIHFLG